MATTNDNFVDTTDPAPFAQTIFLSQKMINNGFSAMWDMAQLEDDEDNPLKYFSYAIRAGDKLQFKVGKPTVSLQVTTKDPMLYFQLRMTEGEVLLYLTDDPEDDSSINWDIRNWIFSFSVTIARKVITKDSEEYKQFKERAGLPNSNFTLAVLFIDASSTTKWNPDLSDFGDKNDEFRNLTPEARATFDTFIQRWLNVMNQKGQSILGYSAERQEDDELNEYAPTFPPTSIDYYCYPWKGADGSAAPRDNQDSNALSYLMMSNFEEPPSHEIAYTGAWVDNADRLGTFCMNRALFWPWMQNVLRKVVIGMVPYPDTPYVEYDPSDPDLPFMSGMRYHAGDDDAQDDQYKFQSMGALLPRTWIVNGPSRHSEKTAVHGNDKNDKMKLQEDTTSTTAMLKFYSGREQVDLSGGSTFTFRADHNTSKRHTYTLMTFNISWAISLTMASVEDGGLQFKIVQGSERVNSTHSKEGGMRWGRDPADIAKDWESRLKTGMQSALNRVQNNLLYALANQQRLFLPGGKGSYLMKNPKFNSKGDLLVNLTFNGADPPKQRKRHLQFSPEFLPGEQ